MRKLKWFLLFLVIAGLAYLVFPWDSQAPEVNWLETPDILGRDGQIRLDISDAGKGLRSITVTLVQGDARFPLLSETFAGSGWPWEKQTAQRGLALPLLDAEGKALLKEGSFEIEVHVEDQPNLLFFNSEILDRKQLVLDLTPPRVEVLSGPHYIRQGGTEAVLYRVSEEVASSGAQVGDNVFLGYPVREGERVHIALFALNHDQDPDAPVLAWARDAAGNRGQASISRQAFPVRFRSRSLTVSDDFIEKVAADILPHSPQVSRGNTPLETFLAINSRLREINHQQIQELTRSSAPERLWTLPFLQLSNSQVEALFADRRTYLYEGREVDQQTHQGYDLASTAQSPVESANDGRVLWADYLGIYGNCVIIDHGWGLVSLYGHLSSIDVGQGQAVSRGQVLGRTGQSGLAGGDHLHFSMILQGIQVNPLEWWDPKWIRDHIQARLELANP